MPEIQKEALAPALGNPQGDYYMKYYFSDDHRTQWQTFWHSINGSMDECLKFADKGNLLDPEQWCASLYKSLFSVWPGNPALLAKEAKVNSLQSYVVLIADTHRETPREKSFYMKLGITGDDFVRVMDSAKAFEGEYDIVQYINARIPDYGNRVLEEYALQVGGFEKIQRKIANLRKMANKIRKEASKLDIDIEVSASEVNV
jgi:hypothetical protein